MEIGTDSRIERAIILAAAAGGMAYWARKEPKAAAGLTRAANSYRGATNALLADWINGAASQESRRPDQAHYPRETMPPRA